MILQALELVSPKNELARHPCEQQLPAKIACRMLLPERILTLDLHPSRSDCSTIGVEFW